MRKACLALAGAEETFPFDADANEIVVGVAVRRPGVLVINQIADDDWHLSEGTLLRDESLLRVRLSRAGEYEVRLRYVPRRLYIGLVLSALTALAGGAVLVLVSRRPRARISREDAQVGGKSER